MTSANSLWTRVYVRPEDPKSEFYYVFDQQKTLEMFNAADVKANTPEVRAQRAKILAEVFGRTSNQ